MWPDQGLVTIQQLRPTTMVMPGGQFDDEGVDVEGKGELWVVMR